MTVLLLSSIICKYSCLNVIVNINSFGVLNIFVNTNLKYYDNQGFNDKLRAIEFFRKSYWAIKYLILWSPGLQNIFWKICKTLRHPLSPPTYLMCTMLLMNAVPKTKFEKCKTKQLTDHDFNSMIILIVQIMLKLINFRK